MIEKTDAKRLFLHNLNRTNMLIDAIDTIHAYDRIYQLKQTNPEYLKCVESSQNRRFKQIEKSCEEHAVISIATSFETYYKEILQQLLFQFPDHFTSRITKHTTELTTLFNNEYPVNYEQIEAKLNLRNRFDYYNLFKIYNIDFLLPEEDKFIEHIYLKRNNYVHNAGRIDAKIQKRINVKSDTYYENGISTQAKRSRTKFKRIIFKLHDRIIKSLT